MEYITKEIKAEVKGYYDVIVAGSGPSGMGAAVKAARVGAKVLLIEYCGSVGGISTTGLMSHFTGRVKSSLYEEILRRASEKNLYPSDFNIIDPEILKITYLEMLAEHNVDILLYTLVCDAIVEDNKVTGVLTQSKSGTAAYYGKVTIDCTGDGDVAYYAGAEFCLGRESDSKMQPATLMFKVAGVDMDRAVFPGSFESQVETPKGEIQHIAKEKLPFPAGHVLLYRTTFPGVVTCNMTNAINIDGTKAEDLTKAEIICRSQMEPIVAFLREYVPGYENCYIISAASLMGIRETRHFVGEKQITEEDILSARQFEDWIVEDAYFNFDVHNMSGASLDETGMQKKFPQQRGYSIPYGCIVPKNLDGLLLSGRNISGTHLAHSNFRVMPICVAIGEAAGCAAAIATKRNISLRDVPVADIQKSLRL